MKNKLYLLECDDASLLAKMKDPSSEKVQDAIEVPRAAVEPELVGIGAVAVAELQRVVHGSNLLQPAKSSLRKLLHQGPGHLRRKRRGKRKMKGQTNSWGAAVVVAQLAEWSLPTPEIRSLNPSMDNKEF